MNEERKLLREKKYMRAFALEASWNELSNMHHGIAIADCYDIDLIRKAFSACRKGEIDGKYFEKWCRLYGQTLQRSYPLLSYRDYAYRKIAELLLEAGEYGEDDTESLQNIELQNKALLGEAEVCYDWPSDLENFCVYLGKVGEDEWEYEDEEESLIVDILTIDHREKTFFIYRDINRRCANAYELFEEKRYTRISRAALNGIYIGLRQTGYKGKTVVDLNDG